MSKTKMFSIQAIYRKERDANGQEIDVFDHYDTSTLDNDVVSLDWDLSDPDAERHTTKDVYAKLVTTQSDGVIKYAKSEPKPLYTIENDSNGGTAWHSADCTDEIRHIMADIIADDIPKRTAIACIKRMTKPIKTTEDGKQVYSDAFDACQAIIDAHFKDQIFEDIVNDLLLTMYDMLIAGEMWVVRNSEDGSKHFSYALTDDDKSTHDKYYTSIRKTLGRQSNRSVAHGRIVKIDAITDSENAITTKNTRYMQFVRYDGAVNDVIMRAEVGDYWKYIATKVTTARYNHLMQVFTGLIIYDDNESIATAYNLSINVVKKCRADLHKLYEEWKTVGGGLDYGSDYHPMLGITRADDFDVAMNAVYKRIIHKFDGDYEVYKAHPIIQWYKNRDFKHDNEVRDWGKLDGKQFLRHKKIEMPKNTEVSAIYNHNNGGLIEHKDRENLAFMPLYGNATADNADYTDVYAEVFGEKIAINAVYGDDGAWNGVEWAVVKDDNYNNVVIEPTPSNEKTAKPQHDKYVAICNYRKTLEDAYPHELRLKNPRLQAKYDDLLKAKRSELGL